jgi:hypothetical protein
MVWHGRFADAYSYYWVALDGPATAASMLQNAAPTDKIPIVYMGFGARPAVQGESIDANKRSDMHAVLYSIWGALLSAGAHDQCWS